MKSIVSKLAHMLDVVALWEYLEQLLHLVRKNRRGNANELSLAGESHGVDEFSAGNGCQFFSLNTDCVSRSFRR